MLAGVSSNHAFSAEKLNLPNGQVSARSFVDQSQIVSKFTSELYAHQCSMRIVGGIGYVAYQCNEATTAENATGQVVRMAIFNILNPTVSVKWVDVASPGEASGGIAISGLFVASPILHAIGDDRIRIFFSSRRAATACRPSGCSTRTTSSPPQCFPTCTRSIARLPKLRAPHGILPCRRSSTISTFCLAPVSATALPRV